MGLSIGLNSAMRSLLAHQQAMDVLAHNVANANTPGYSRQRVVLAQTSSGTPGVGGGVEVADITRVYDRFIDVQTQAENGTAGDYHARATSLSFVEAILGTGTGGLQGAMDLFFNAWRDLSNAPEQSAVRAGVITTGQGLALTANQIASGLAGVRADANGRIVTAVDEVNTLAQQVATLNRQILEARASGGAGSALADQRGLLLGRLSQLVDVRTVEHESGGLDVLVASRTLVNNVEAHQLVAIPDPLDNNFVDVQWATDGAPLAVRAGEIAGLLHQRDVDVLGRIATLDTLVAQVVADVNAVHAAGYALDGVTTGRVFFTGTTAATVEVDATLAADATLLAAATSPAAPGDGRNALALANLQQAPSMSGGLEDYSSFWNSIVTSAGVANQTAQRIAESQQLRLDHLEAMRQNGAGVNIDEEMVSMVQFQRGYEAAARVIRAIDEMLDNLLR